MAKKNHHPVSAEVENNPLYHDTYKLLRCYRDSTYSLMVAVRQVEIQFQLEYNTSVDEFLDSIYAAGADLGDRGRYLGTQGQPRRTLHHQGAGAHQEKSGGQAAKAARRRPQGRRCDL